MRVSILLMLLLLPLSAVAAVQVGEVPPDYVGQDRDGKDIRLSGHRGKVVAVTFWATWCGPCMQEIPILEAVQRQVGKSEIEIVAVNFKESSDKWRTIRRKLSDLQLTLSRDTTNKVIEAYGVKGIPHLFLIGKDGRVAYIHVGYDASSLPGIVEELNALLAEAPPEAIVQQPVAETQ